MRQPTPYYDQDGITLYLGDCRQILPQLQVDTVGCLVVDPPWDDAAAVAAEIPLGAVQKWGGPDRLVFTDPRRMHDALERWGHDIAWVFTWDTMNTWQTGSKRPVQQSKFCLWYGLLDEYRRDAVLHGDAPPERDHPTTKQTPLDGRRLVDLHRESLRWLHHPGAGNGSAGTERFGKRQGHPALRHAKPVAWLRCLLGNCSDGLVLDPFAGSGTTLRAAKDLRRPAIGIEIDEAACELAVERLAQGALDFAP